MKRILLVLLSMGACASAAAAEKVLVFGGTGRLGSEIVRSALAKGYAVAVFARAQSSRERLAGSSVEYLTGDLGKIHEVKAAIGAARPTVIIDASGRRTADQSFSHAVTMPAIVKAARRAGVRQILFVSSVGAGDNIRMFPNLPWGEYIPLLEERGKAERSLMEGPIQYTIIRTGNVPDPSVAATGAAYLTEDQSVIGATTRRDLADLMVNCIAAPACRNKVYHAADRKLKSPL